MTPRKRIVASGYALNADRLDDLETGNAGGTSAYVPVADANGNLVITGDPQGSGIAQGSLTVNPTSADANELLFGVGLNGSARFSVDEDGDVTTMARVETAAHNDGVGLNLPTNAGAPAAVVGTVEGDIVWDSSNDALYVYDGAAFSEVGGGGAGVSTVGSMSAATVFADATADDDWIGLGAGAGNILFDDQATDEVIVQNAYFGVNVSQPLAYIHAVGGTAAGLNEVLRVSGGGVVNGSGPSMVFSDYGWNPNWEMGEIGVVYNSGSGVGGDMVFYTNSGGSISDTSEKVRIRYDGNVGIGDASPTALLTVGNGELFTVDSSGNVTTTKRVDTAAHANNVGLNLPTNAGIPAAVTGTVEGDIVWDSTNDDLYVYDGAAFAQVNGGGGGGITTVGSMSSDPVFADATADDDWLGLGAAAGNILFDDQATDEVIVQNAYFGVNVSQPLARMHALGGTDGGLNEVLRISGGSTSSESGPSIVFNQYFSGSYPTWEAAEIGAVYQGGGGYQGSLVFYTNNGSTVTDTSEKMRIDDDGNVGIGTGSTISSLLHVNGSGGLTGDNSDLALIYSSSDEPTGISFNTPNEQWFVGQNLPPDLGGSMYDDFYIYNVDDSKTRFLIEDNGTTSIDVLAAATSNDLCYSTTDVSGMYTFSSCAPSSIRYKENIRPLEVDIENVLALEPVRFDWKQRFVENPDGDPVDITPQAPNFGLIAENTLPLVPDLVEFNADGQVESVEYKLLSVYNLAVLKQHHLDIARSLKLDQTTGEAYEIESRGLADAINTAVASKDLTFIGSAWNEITGLADTVKMSLSNQVNDLNDYGLVLTDNASNEVARFNNDGDFYLGGRMFLSDRGSMQDSRYIYYDGSEGAAGDFIRTNAAGWSTGSYDFAEMFPSDEELLAGDLVMFDVTGDEKVRRADNTLESNGYLLAGIVSTRPGFLAGLNEVGSYPVALQGRVPTRVSLENGPIQVGDPIAISSEAGVGMRATSADYVVGLALENYDGSGNSDLITVFIKVGWYDGRDIRQANNDNSELPVAGLNGILDMGGQPIVGIGALQGIDGLWTLDTEGRLTVQSVDAGDVEADRLTVRAEDTLTTVGEGVIPVGSYEYVVENPAVGFNSRVFVTFFDNIEGSWWVDERSDGRFKIKLSSVASTDVEFEYWVLGVSDGRTHTGQEDDGEEEVIEEEPAEEEVIEEEPVEEEVVEEPAEEEVIEEEPVEEEVVEEPAEEPEVVDEDPAVVEEMAVEPELAAVQPE